MLLKLFYTNVALLSSPPPYRFRFLIDTTTPKLYFSVAVSSSTDWKEIPLT